MAILRFQCSECGFGNREVGDLMDEDEIYCVVCLQEQGRLIRIRCWEEPDQARLRPLLEAA
jgi:hypothetical protein